MGPIDTSGIAYLAMIGMGAVAVLLICIPGAIVGAAWWAVQPRLGLPWDGLSVGLAVSSVGAIGVGALAFDIFKR